MKRNASDKQRTVVLSSSNEIRLVETIFFSFLYTVTIIVVIVNSLFDWIQDAHFQHHQTNINHEDFFDESIFLSNVFHVEFIRIASTLLLIMSDLYPNIILTSVVRPSVRRE